MKLLTTSASTGLQTSSTGLKTRASDLHASNADLQTTSAGLQTRASSTYFQTRAIALLLLWILAQRFIAYQDPTAGSLDPNIWLLLLFSLISFLLLLGICFWLLQLLLRQAGLSNLYQVLSQLKNQSSWQQIQFYWASFIALLLAAVGVLTAIL